MFFDMHFSQHTNYFHIFKCNFSDCSYRINLLGERIETFPDAIPYTDPVGVEHHKAGKDSNDKFMSSKLIDATNRKTNVPFPTSAETASNVGIFFRCINFRWPRSFYAQKNVQASELNILKRVLSSFQFTCGTSLQEMIHTSQTVFIHLPSPLFK